MSVASATVAIWTALVWSNWLTWNGWSSGDWANVAAPYAALTFDAAIAAAAGHAPLVGWAAVFWLAAWGAGGPAARWVGATPRGSLRAALGACVLGFSGLGAGLAGIAFPSVAQALVLVGAAAGARRLRLPVGLRAPSAAEALLGLLLGVGCLLPLIGALAPEASFDGMAHHLAHPELYAAAHRVHAMPSHFLATYPALLEMQYLVARLVSGTAQLARLVHWGWGVLTLAALLGWARERMEGVWALAAAVVFVFLPYVQLVMMWAYVDLGAACLLTLALRGALSARPRGAPLGLLCGLAAGVKVTGIFAAVLVAAILAARRAPAGVWGRAAGAGALALGPWAAKNFLFAGSPTAPFFSGLLPVLWWAPENHARYQQELASYDAGPASLHGPLAFFSRPWDASVHNTGVLDTRAGMGAWFLWGLPLAAVAGPGGAPLLAALGWYALWQLIPHQVRYLLPAWPAAAIACAAVAQRVARGSRAGRCVVWGVGALLVWQVPLALRLQREAGDPVRVVFGAESPERYLARGMPGHEPGLRTRAWLAVQPGTERALVANQYGLGLFWGPRAVTQSFFDTPLIERVAAEARTGDDFRRRFRQLRIGRVVCDTENNMLMQASYGIYRLAPAAGARWRDYWSRSARLECSADGRLLVYRLDRPGAVRPVSVIPGLDEQALARLDDAQAATERRGQTPADLAAAEATYLDAATRSNLPAAWERLGLIRLRAGRRGPAREALRRAAGLGRETAALRNGLGVVDAQEGRLDPAMEAFRRALALDPGYTTARRNLAMCLKGRGRTAEGLLVLQEGLARDPGSGELREAWGLLTGRNP